MFDEVMNASMLGGYLLWTTRWIIWREMRIVQVTVAFGDAVAINFEKVF